jgi:hypothetical protein
MKVRVMIVAERETTIQDILEINRQDHIVQILQLGYDLVTVSFEKVKDDNNG